MALEGTALKSPPDRAGERDLIEAARSDPRRFGELYEDNFERVYAFVLRRVRHREEAQDLTAEVFQRALAGLARYEWRGAPFSAWLYRIAVNAIIDRAQRSVNETVLPETLTDDAASLEDIEERARAFRLAGELPSDQRQVIVLRFAQQRSIREIAAILERSEGAVKQLQFRALRTLRAQLGEPHA